MGVLKLDYLKGLDISHHQNDAGEIDWEKVSSAFDFVFIKATEGETFVDPKHEINIKNAKSHNMITGAYHFARYKSIDEAEREANFFISKVKELQVDYFILDLEHASDLRQANIHDITNATNAFMNVISNYRRSLQSINHISRYPYSNND